MYLRYIYHAAPSSSEGPIFEFVSGYNASMKKHDVVLTDVIPMFANYPALSSSIRIPDNNEIPTFRTYNEDIDSSFLIPAFAGDTTAGGNIFQFSDSSFTSLHVQQAFSYYQAELGRMQAIATRLVSIRGESGFILDDLGATRDPWLSSLSSIENSLRSAFVCRNRQFKPYRRSKTLSPRLFHQSSRIWNHTTISQ